MKDIDQATINYQWAQAVNRQLMKVSDENKQLREIVEVMRLHLINLASKRVLNNG